MPDTVISVENLSKQYVLGKRANSEGLRHAIYDLASAPLRWLKSRGNTPATIPGRNGMVHTPKKTSKRLLRSETAQAVASYMIPAPFDLAW